VLSGRTRKRRGQVENIGQRDMLKKEDREISDREVNTVYEISSQRK
jgi:hypothetical protein